MTGSNHCNMSYKVAAEKKLCINLSINSYEDECMLAYLFQI